MSDLISRSALIAAIVEVRNTIPVRVPCAPYELLDDRPWAAGQNQRGGIRKALRCVNDAPSVDAVEVVRCWQCKHRSEIPNTDLYLCHKSYAGCKADDFCSYGERKDGGKDD